MPTTRHISSVTFDSSFGCALKERGFSSSKYRFGFNGMEKDDDLKGEGNNYFADFRLLDTRLGRWLSLDPIIKTWESPYACFLNNPIYFNDPSGLDPDKGSKRIANRQTRKDAKKFIRSHGGKKAWDKHKHKENGILTITVTQDNPPSFGEQKNTFGGEAAFYSDNTKSRGEVRSERSEQGGGVVIDYHGTNYQATGLTSHPVEFYTANEYFGFMNPLSDNFIFKPDEPQTALTIDYRLPRRDNGTSSQFGLGLHHLKLREPGYVYHDGGYNNLVVQYTFLYSPSWRKNRINLSTTLGLGPMIGGLSNRENYGLGSTIQIDPFYQAGNGPSYAFLGWGGSFTFKLDIKLFNFMYFSYGMSYHYSQSNPFVNINNVTGAADIRDFTLSAMTKFWTIYFLIPRLHIR